MEFFGHKEFKTQLYFQDDNKFKFIKRELQYTCLVEQAQGVLVRGWKHFFSNQLYFPGYKKLSADTVILGFARDVILDPFNKIPVGESISEKPNTKDKDGRKRWVKKMAENQRHIFRTQRKNTYKEDIVNYCLMGILGIMVIVWLVSFLKGLYA